MGKNYLHSLLFPIFCLSQIPPAKSYSKGPEYLDKEGRRAMIGGALSAMLLVGGLLAAGFAVAILIIGHLH